MKTLSEVIAEMEGMEFIGTLGDALHYLKEYKIKRERIMAKAQDCEDAEKRLQNEINRYQEAVKEYEEILTDYVALKQYWAEQQANSALSWEELQQMVGKPVWIEAESISVGVSPYWKDWYIIKSFSNDEFMHCNDGYEWAKETQGRMWQAYRKEKAS